MAIEFDDKFEYNLDKHLKTYSCMYKKDLNFNLLNNILQFPYVGLFKKIGGLGF